MRKQKTQEQKMIEQYRSLSHDRVIIARRYIARYNEIHNICVRQYKYPEATNRYDAAMKWNDLISEVLRIWDSIYPDRAQVVREYFGIHPCKKLSAVQISMKRFMSENTVFKYVRQFVADVAQGLIPSMLE